VRDAKPKLEPCRSKRIGNMTPQKWRRPIVDFEHDGSSLARSIFRRLDSLLSGYLQLATDHSTFACCKAQAFSSLDKTKRHSEYPFESDIMEQPWINHASGLRSRQYWSVQSHHHFANKISNPRFRNEAEELGIYTPWEGWVDLNGSRDDPAYGLLLERSLEPQNEAQSECA
jgi:hypothetical protein